MLYKIAKLLDKEIPLGEALTFSYLNAVFMLSLVLLAFAIILIIIYILTPPEKKGTKLPPLAKYGIVVFVLVAILTIVMVLRLPDKSETDKTDPTVTESYIDIQETIN